MPEKNRGNQRRWAVHPRHLLRRRIASFLARGLEEYEIVQLLSEEYLPDGDGGQRPNRNRIVNPKTGQPYNQSTINRAIHKILDEWKEKNSEKLDLYFARVIGENAELRRQAWQIGDYGEVRLALTQLINLLGLAAPQRYSDVSEEEIERLAEEWLAGQLAAARESESDAGSGSEDGAGDAPEVA